MANGRGLHKKKFALLIAAALATGLSLTAPEVMAQSNSTGSIYGTVSGAGKSTVVIENADTNSRRTVVPDETGRYQVTSLPPGRYKVTLQRDGSTIASQDIEVLIAKGSEVNLGDGTTLESVVVRSSRPLVDSTATNSVSTFTAKELANLPIGQDLTSIILLAPDTVKADPRYAGGASIGGGAPSENSYYINGFPVTNALSQLGSIELPFGAIDQANVLTGGFGAEFGRSTGGVVNIVTKHGGNTWEGGGSVSVTPAGLRATPHDIYYANTGKRPKTDGTLWRYDQATSETEYKYGAYLGGPIVKDKLFVFVALDQTRTNTSGINRSSSGARDSSTLQYNGWADTTDVNNRWLAKFDWQINDDNRLELTTFGDNYQTDQQYYAFDYKTLSRGARTFSASYFNQPNTTPAVGGQATLLKLTSNVTDALTVTALAGQSFTNHSQLYNGLGTGGLPPGITFSTAGQAPGLNYVNFNPLADQDLPPSAAEDTTKAFRLDVEWSLGAHTLRGGIDYVKLSSRNAGEALAGGSTWAYQFNDTPNVADPAAQYPYVLADGNPASLASQGYYVQQTIFSDVTDARSDQSAVYLEDKWQVNKKLFLQLGIRSESFKGINGDGQTYLDSKNFISPRLAGAYDWFGDSSFKLLGSVGRYSIQTPTHLAVRGASVSTFTTQDFRYTGIDPKTGLPTGLTAMTPAYSSDGELGQPKDPNVVAAHNLLPSYQDEFRLGFEKLISPKLVGSFMATYRKLGATLDDFCDLSFATNYAAAHNIPITNPAVATGALCISINPGRTNDVLIDFGTNKQYTAFSLTPALQGFREAPKRTFMAFDFGLEHPFSDDWYGKVTYTWSKNKGNTEGQTKSDTGQTDVSATSTWDFAAIMEGANGYLPSDRRHQIHAFGFWQFQPEFGVGANLTAQSGRPVNCIGNYGGTDSAHDLGYGSAYFYCSFDGGVTRVATPRGTQGRLPWDYSLDLNLSYKPQAVKGLQMRVDVYNLFNRQTVVAVNERHEANNNAGSVRASYLRPVAYSDPRSIKLTAEYAF